MEPKLEHELKFVLRDMEGNVEAIWGNFEQYGIKASNLVELETLVESNKKEIVQSYLSPEDISSIAKIHFPNIDLLDYSKYDTLRFRSEWTKKKGVEQILTMKGRGESSRLEEEKLLVGDIGVELSY
jgi:hypothetical protein